MGEGGLAKRGRKRGVPAWRRRRSFQPPSTVLALRANPPSPTRGEGRAMRRHSALKQRQLFGREVACLALG
ncbi:MAG: hypothetical protein E5W87_24375 [Mesorhizobium sp.]|nr:MAG: hypothetical protein E5W87_24375 [Mesorhizobium sp.]